MNQLDKHEEKQWTSNFALDNARLTRLNEALDDRLSRGARKATFQYVTNTKTKKLSKRTNVDDVLKLDNTRKDPIRYLSVSATATRAGTEELKTSIEFTPETKDNVRVTVAGTDHSLVNDVFAAAYEQIERTFVAPWVRIMQIAALFIFTSIVALTIASLLHPVRMQFPQFSQQDVTTLNALAASAHDSEARINFIFEAERRQIPTLSPLDPGFSFLGHSKIAAFLTGGVILIAAGLLFYVGVFCYPRAVFAWGDYGEYYTKLLARRKGIWKWLTVSLIGGLLIALFGATLQERFHLGGR